MRTYRRQDQLGEAISHELSDLMRTRMKDPRLGFASVTGVELSPDLRHAKVFVSVMGDTQEQRDSMKALNSATGFLRHELAQRLTVRHVPEIEFRLDDSIARGVRVLNLISQVSAADQEHAASQTSEANSASSATASATSVAAPERKDTSAPEME
jgi:ribosome-binding factor A